MLCLQTGMCLPSARSTECVCRSHKLLFTKKPTLPMRVCAGDIICPNEAPLVIITCTYIRTYVLSSQFCSIDIVLPDSFSMITYPSALYGSECYICIHVHSLFDRSFNRVQVLTKEEEEYKMLKQYIENTHAATHNQYELELLEVFKVVREGEMKRFKPFKNLHNHMLLWHGSRTTNYAGILSQGLRIAPPEAPVTGYMFGKGVYFADMVSKSANYCRTSGRDPVGLLLLCEVALGDMYVRMLISNIKCIHLCTYIHVDLHAVQQSKKNKDSKLVGHFVI